MSWPHAASTEITALFVEGSIFGALALYLAKDAARRLSRMLKRRRYARFIEHDRRLPKSVRGFFKVGPNLGAPGGTPFAFAATRVQSRGLRAANDTGEITVLRAR